MGREGNGRTEYDDRHVDRTEDTELVCLLEEAVLALWINDREDDNYKCQAGNKNSYRATFRNVTERLRSCYV